MKGVVVRIKPKERWNVRKLLKHPFLEGETHKQSYMNRTDELMSILNQSKFKQSQNESKVEQ